MIVKFEYDKFKNRQLFWNLKPTNHMRDPKTTEKLSKAYHALSQPAKNIR